MNIEIVTVGPFEVNCAIVWKEKSQAIVIDPGFDAEEIEAVLKSNELSVSAFLLTHGHADHISALAKLHKAHPAPVYLHPNDQKWAFTKANEFLPYTTPEKPDAAFPEFGTELSIADFKIQILETPGHSAGGICYRFKDEGICFSGDTLFRGTCGRTDLPGGDARVLSASLKILTDTLSCDTKIIPGHGPATTMDYEIRTNYFLSN